MPTNSFARYHVPPNPINGGGVSSGLDAALLLAATCLGGKDRGKAGKRSYLVKQYTLAPPFYDGLPHQPSLIWAVLALYRTIKR